MLNVNIQEIRRINGEVSSELLPAIIFYIKPGNIYTLTGRNGSGKTTLLKSITSLLDKRYYKIYGRVVFKGTDLLSLSETEINSLRKKEIKHVLQDSISSFDPLKKLDYYFSKLSQDRLILDSLLSKFSLPPKSVLRYMHSYELSGGMAQRLSIVFALSAKPSLILLDEPNSAVDSETSKTISDIMINFVKESGSSVLLTTQDLDFAENISDYIGYLNNSFYGFHEKKDFFNNPAALPELTDFIAAYRLL